MEGHQDGQGLEHVAFQERLKDLGCFSLAEEVRRGLQGLPPATDHRVQGGGRDSSPEGTMEGRVVTHSPWMTGNFNSILGNYFTMGW